MRPQSTSQDTIRIEVTEAEIHRRLDEIERADISDDLRDFLIKALKALIRLDQLLGMKYTTIARLRKVFAKESERRKPEVKEPKEKRQGKNHGRNGLEKYPTAEKVHHSHEHLKKGDRCPECGRGRLYNIDPGVYIKITGSAPLTAVVHRTEKLRCSACQMVFEADFRGRDGPKYDAKAKAVIGLLKYAASTPFYRLEKIQKSLLTPLPASTQWDLMEELANDLHPLWRCLLITAAQGELGHIDDTTAKILSLPAEADLNKAEAQGKRQRKGIYTTGVLSRLSNQQQVVLYLTGRKYAGENLDDVLDKREESLPAMVVMRDALNTNNTDRNKVYEVLCLVHARRGFIDLDQKYKEEVDFVLSAIGLIYKNDTHCRESRLTAEERLRYHQEHSTKIWDDLTAWARRQIDLKLVEPNSDLGRGIKYLVKHAEKLGRFLKTPGVPLDNNVLEEKLRLPVLNRKNFLFYRTEMGALVGDIIMSVIKSADISHVNPIDYLAALQEHRDAVKREPSAWLPWNYQANLLS